MYREWRHSYEYKSRKLENFARKKQTHESESKVMLLINDLCEVSGRLSRVLSEANVRLKEKGIIDCNTCMTEAEQYKKYLRTIRILEMLVNGVFEKEQIRELDSSQNKSSKSFDVYISTDKQKQINMNFKQTQCCGSVGRNKKLEHNLKCFLIKLQQTVGELILQICFLKSQADLFSKSEQLKIFNVPIMTLKILNFEYTNLTDKIIYLINFETHSIESNRKTKFDGHCILCAKEEINCLLDSLDSILCCTKQIKLLPIETKHSNDLSMCCHRCVPHIHGEINGNLVVLKFNQPKGKTCSGAQTSEVDKPEYESNEFEIRPVLKKDKSCNTSEIFFQRENMEKNKHFEDEENKLPTIIDDKEHSYDGEEVENESITSIDDGEKSYKEKNIEPPKNDENIEQMAEQGKQNSENINDVYKEEESSSAGNYSGKKLSHKEIEIKLIGLGPELSKYTDLNKLLHPVPSSDTLPYVISLQSLPLTENDIRYLDKKTKKKSVEEDETNDNNKQYNVFNVSVTHTSNGQVYNIFDKETGPFIPSLSSLVLSNINVQAVKTNRNVDGLETHSVEIRYFLSENDRKYFSLSPVCLFATPLQLTKFPSNFNSNFNINRTSDLNEICHDLISSEPFASVRRNSALELQIENINDLHKVASDTLTRVSNLKINERDVILSEQGISEKTFKKCWAHKNLQFSNGDHQTQKNICLKSFIPCFVNITEQFNLKRGKNVLINLKGTENYINKYKNIVSRSNGKFDVNLIKLSDNETLELSNVIGVDKRASHDINIFDGEINKKLSAMSFTVNEEMSKLKMNEKEINFETKKKLLILKFIKHEILEQIKLSGKAKKIVNQICYNTTNVIEKKLSACNKNLMLESLNKELFENGALLKHFDDVDKILYNLQDLNFLVFKIKKDQLFQINGTDTFPKMFTNSRDSDFKVLLSTTMQSKKHNREKCLIKKSCNSRAICTFKRPVFRCMRFNVYLELPEIKYATFCDEKLKNAFCSFIPKFKTILIKHDVYLNTEIKIYEPKFLKIRFKIVDSRNVHCIFQKALLTLVKEALILKVEKIIKIKHKNTFQIIRLYPNRNTMFEWSSGTNLARGELGHSLKKINTYDKKSSNIKLDKCHNKPKPTCNRNNYKAPSIRNKSHIQLHSFKGYNHTFNKLEQQTHKQHGHKRSNVYILNRKQIKFYKFWKELSVPITIPWQ